MGKPLVHAELPVKFIEYVFLLFGDPDKVVWHKLNQSYYPNRKPHQRFFGGLRMEYVKARGKYYVLSVTPT